MTGQLEIAALFTAAMSKPGATQLKALSAVMSDDLTVAGKRGADEIAEWMKTWPGKSMFRTGTWTEPEPSGDVVTVTCLFDAKAAYYGGVLTLTIPDGVITEASMLVLAGPEPLGSIISRCWGPRRGMDGLAGHVASAYDITVAKLTDLDNGVVRIDRANGDPWVARVFPGDRPIAEVEGDAAVLAFLEGKGFPAERCVAPVSTHEGQGVLVTAFVAGKQAQPSRKNVTEMASMLGRLHTLERGPKAVKRPAGGLHLYSADTSVRSELDTAIACLEAGAFRGTDGKHAELMDALKTANDFTDLPAALSHPDYHVKNTIASKDGLVPIDWAGAGYAPRVLALGMLLFYGSLEGKGWDPARVDAMAEAYAEHVTPTAAELDRLPEAMQRRMLVHEVYAWCSGMARRRKPDSFKEWPGYVAQTEKVAARVREVLGG